MTSIGHISSEPDFFLFLFLCQFLLKPIQKPWKTCRRYDTLPSGITSTGPGSSAPAFSLSSSLSSSTSTSFEGSGAWGFPPLFYLKLTMIWWLGILFFTPQLSEEIYATGECVQKKSTNLINFTKKPSAEKRNISVDQHGWILLFCSVESQCSQDNTELYV